jgi:formate dehydrogenase iron-sulfur subunit
MKAILVDVTKCKGCMACVNACVSSKGGDASGVSKGESALSAEQLSTVVPLEGGGHAKKGCMHCVDPNCAAACLVGAIEKTPSGPVVYDAEKCIGCRYCMLACPFHVPRYEWESTEPLMKKCDMCADRLEQGKLPACALACTHEAIEFGDREALIEKARSVVRANSGAYLDHVWGETEWGGTSLIYISSVSLEALGWPGPRTTDPISAATDPLIHATPVVGLSVLLGSWALGAVIARRNKLMNNDNSREDVATDDIQQEDGDAE